MHTLPPLLLPAAFLFSKPYVVSMTVAALEYGLEARFLPVIKTGWPGAAAVAAAGLALVVAGEALRKAAILTARGAFTHVIRRHRAVEHRLVTHGVYGGWRGVG